jgi:Ca2+-binding EF-hand superfamily protein
LLTPFVISFVALFFASFFVSGLSVLCGGDPLVKAQATFMLYDSNGDGVISLDELVAHLASVFTAKFATGGGRPDVSPVELAVAMAEQVFADADVDHDGVLTWEEFAAWTRMSEGYGDDSSDSSERASDGEARLGARLMLPEQAMSMQIMRHTTALATLTVQEAFEIFAGGADEEGMLGEAAFMECFEEIVDYAVLTDDEADNVSFVCATLFGVFDVNGDGVIDFTELASGLSVLCGGTRDEKARAAFALYDYDGDGVISLEEMTRYLTSVFRVMYEAQPGTREAMGGVEADDLAARTAEEAFEAADVDADGVLSWAEFEAWYRVNNAESASVSTGEGAGGAEEGEVTLSLTTVRDATGLGAMPVEDALEIFAAGANEEGLLGPETFIECFEDVVDVDALDDDARERLESIITKLFSIFDVNGDGVIDFTELASGLSVLCGGTRDEKARAAFALYDYDGDGVITLEEMTRYLTSVFRVMYEAQPGTREAMGGVGVEELAANTAMQAFEDARADAGSGMNLEQFTLFTSAGGGGAAQGAAAAPAARAVAAPDLGRQWSTEAVQSSPRRGGGGGGGPWDDLFPRSSALTRTLHTLSEALGLSEAAFGDVLAGVAMEADATGLVGLDGFVRACGEGVDARRVASWLFSAECLGDGDAVDFQQLVCAVALLCGGDRSGVEAKAHGLFEVFDFDDEGLVTATDLAQLVRSVALLKYACMPDTEAPALAELALDLVSSIVADTGLDLMTRGIQFPTFAACCARALGE